LASLPPAQQICISRALLSGPFWGVYDQVKTPRLFQRKFDAKNC
jgi:hypothetical protein